MRRCLTLFLGLAVCILATMPVQALHNTGPPSDSATVNYDEVGIPTAELAPEPVSNTRTQFDVTHFNLATRTDEDVGTDVNLLNTYICTATTGHGHFIGSYSIPGELIHVVMETTWTENGNGRFGAHFRPEATGTDDGHEEKSRTFNSTAPRPIRV